MTNTELLKHFHEAYRLNKLYFADLIKHQAWFRGSLNSKSLVSLHPARPQLKIKNIAQLKEASNANVPGRSTPEKLLQSWIIYSAISNQGRLHFDPTITFITDEFARPIAGKKLVVDLFGFNNITKTFVLIELKSTRALIELTKQLTNAEALVRQEAGLYQELLRIHGYEWAEPFRIEKVAVWPTSSKTYKLFSKDIREICYTPLTDKYIFHELKDR